MDILDRVAEALDRAHAENRRPIRLLLGNLETGELEAALYRPAKRWFGLFGDVIGCDGEFAPRLTLGMGPATLFGVPIERVDQPMLLGVLTEEGAS